MERLFPNSHVLIANLNHYKDRPGGAGRLAWDEAHFLARNGHRVTMLAAASSPDQPERKGRRFMPVALQNSSPQSC